MLSLSGKTGPFPEQMSEVASTQEGEGRVRATYGVNYERLVSLKSRYDPTNFFALNQNIAPIMV